MTEPSAPPSSEDLALRDGEFVFPAAETRYVLATHELGEVPVPSGWRAWWESNGFLVRFIGGFLLVAAAIIGIAHASGGPKRPRLEPVRIQWRR